MGAFAESSHYWKAPLKVLIIGDNKKLKNAKT
jgi:hypothetical protein